MNDQTTAKTATNTSDEPVACFDDVVLPDDVLVSNNRGRWRWWRALLRLLIICAVLLTASLLQADLIECYAIYSNNELANALSLIILIDYTLLIIFTQKFILQLREARRNKNV